MGFRARHYFARAAPVSICAATPIHALCADIGRVLASPDDFLTSSEAALDAEERMNQNDKAQVQEILNQLREEVKEMERTSWLYENAQQQEQVIKV